MACDSSRGAPDETKHEASPEPKAESEPRTEPAPSKAQVVAKAPKSKPTEPEPAEPEPEPEPKLPVYGEVSLEDAMAALAELPTFEEESVRAVFARYEITVLHPNHPNTGYFVRKDGEELVFLFRNDGRLGGADVEGAIAIGGFTRGDPFGPVIDSAETSCRHEPGEDCTVVCALRSGWIFDTTLRSCPKEEFDPITKARAKQLVPRRAKIEGIHWERPQVP